MLSDLQKRKFATAFRGYDYDGDGKIPRQEISALVRQWLGDDPNTPGNFLLGAQ
jgi:hypothetical protein